MLLRERKINLLPKEYVQAEKFKKGLISATGILVLEMIAFIFLVAMPPKAEILETERQLDLLLAEIDNSRFTEINLMLQELETTQVDVSEWKALCNELKRENFISKRVLDSLVSRTPLALTINKLTIMPEEKGAIGSIRTIRIEGHSTEAIAVLNYTTIIEQAFGIGTTHYEMAYDEQAKVYQYTIDVMILVETKNVQEVSNETIEEVVDMTGENIEVAEEETN